MAKSDDAIAESSAEEVESKLEKLEIDDSASAEAAAKVESNPSISFNIWPPSEGTRNLIVSQLIDNLALQPPIWKNHRVLPVDELKVIAKQVEEEFAVAGGDKKVDDDEFEVLRVYSKEISKRMLEVLKARAGGNADVAKEESQNEKVLSTEEVESESN